MIRVMSTLVVAYLVILLPSCMCQVDATGSIDTAPTVDTGRADRDNNSVGDFGFNTSIPTDDGNGNGANTTEDSRSSSSSSSSSSSRKNVLFVVFDDLRPQFQVYGQTFGITPHLDALAQRSVVFENAFTSYPYCNPSRNSFMTGRSPATTRVFNFIDHFREPGIGADWTPLPEHFKKQGYWTAGAGKLYHPNLPPDEDNPRSWSIDFKDYGGNSGCACPNVTATPMYCELPDDTQCPDVNITETVVSQLRTWRQHYSDRPFFIGLGIHKPHLPWGVPKRFFDRLPPAEELPLAMHPLVPVGMPDVAYHHCQWEYFPWNSSRGHPVANATAHLARRAYYAAVAFADDLLGQALSELERVGAANNTVILVTGDHGWLLGEHNSWCKESLFDNALHVPLIIHDPLQQRPSRHEYNNPQGAAGDSRRADGGVAAGVGGGFRTGAFAELLDVYKTLADLAGVGGKAVEAGVEGDSLAHIVRGHAFAAADATANGPDPNSPFPSSPSSPLSSMHSSSPPSPLSSPSLTLPPAPAPKTMACSQMAHCLFDPKTNATIDPFKVADSCTMVPRNRLQYMGYSCRTNEWRYTEWRYWIGEKLQADWSRAPKGIELYAHAYTLGKPVDFDAFENVNLAGKVGLEKEQAQMAALLKSRFQPKSDNAI